MDLRRAASLAATSVKEGAVRIRSALATVGRELPLKRVTVNLAPADLRKPGCALDLPIAACVLIEDSRYDPTPLADLITPNIPEAEALLGGESIRSPDDLIRAARGLARFGSR